MKIKMMITAILAAMTITITANAETPLTRDFTFGLSDEFPAVKAVSDDDDGHDTFERFTQIRNEIPDEIPVFEPFEAKAKHEIYIAKDGNDGNPGTKDKPVKSFDAAFSIAATSPRDGGVIIYIREGIYDVSNGIEIPETISGTEKNPTIISSYQGENVTLTGGVSINGEDFKIADDEVAMRKLPGKVKGKVYSVNLKEMGYTTLPSVTRNGVPQLKVGDTEYTIARWPNAEDVNMGKYTGEDAIDGVIDIGPVTNALTGNTITGDTGEGFEFVFVNPRPLSWENTDDIWLYGSFYAEYFQHYYRIRNINPDKMSIRTYQHAEYGASYNVHHKYYYLNILEELDVPGEWYLDRTTGMLYIYPVSELNGQSVSIPISSSDLLHVTKGVEYVVLNGLQISGTSKTGVYLEGLRNVIQNCTVTGTGNQSVLFDQAKNCGVINSKLYNSVEIKSNLNERINSSHDSTNLRPTLNFVQNNYVIGGQINLRYGLRNIISHNTVLNYRSMCIYVANSQENIIEYNDVCGGPWRTIDGGMLYHEGGTDNIYNHIRYNYFHHSTVKIRSWPFGIYFDDMTSNSFAYGNRVQQGNMFMHGGSRNVFYNNVIIDQTASPSIYNSDNYAKEGGMFQAYKIGWITSTGNGVYYNENGRHKVGQITWKNRYPTLYAWFEGLQEVRKEYLKVGKSEKSDFEREWVAPQENVYLNNVLYNSQAASGDTQFEKEAWRENNYQVPDGEEIFEDYENRVYNIKPESSVYDVIESFEPLPPIEKMGVIELQEKISNSKMYPISPINDENERCFPSGVVFKWTSSPVATYYHLEIARNPDFTDLIGKYTTKENQYIFEGEFEIDSEYYWRVTAECYAVSVQNPMIVMDTAKFKTYTYAEAAANTMLDTGVFEEECKNILAVTERLNEDNGTDIGMAVYKQGTKDVINKLIEASKKRVDIYALQSEVNKEIENMKKEFINILYKNAVPYTRTYADRNLDTWHIDTTKGSVLDNGDGMTIKSATTSSVIAYDSRLLAPGEKVSLKMNFGEMSNWDAFGIKQIETEGKNLITSAKGYYIIVKKDRIELQKYPSVGIIADVVNANNIIKPNMYHDVEVSCTPEDNGVRIIFKVDGVEIINYLDEDNPITDLGYFSIQAFAGGISIK